MEAGRELDALIAEKVMGLELMRDTGMVKSGLVTYRHNFEVAWIEAIVPPYSTDIAAAWQVVEKLLPRAEFLIEKEYSETLDEVGFRASFDLGNLHTYHDEMFCWGKSASLAICLAALKALGIPA